MIRLARLIITPSKDGAVYDMGTIKFRSYRNYELLCDYHAFIVRLEGIRQKE